MVFPAASRARRASAAAVPAGASKGRTVSAASSRSTGSRSALLLTRSCGYFERVLGLILGDLADKRLA